MKTLRTKLVLFSLLSVWFSAYAQTRYDGGVTSAIEQLPGCNQFRMETSWSFDKVKINAQHSLIRLSCHFAPATLQVDAGLMGIYSKLDQPFPIMNLRCDFMSSLAQERTSLLPISANFAAGLPSMNLRCDFASSFNTIGILKMDKPLTVLNLLLIEKDPTVSIIQK